MSPDPEPPTRDTQPPAIFQPAGDATARLARALRAYVFEARSEDLKGAGFAHAPSPAEVVLNGANSSATLVSTLADTLRVGPLAVAGAVVGINDGLPVADFGVDFLEGFNVEFEPQRMAVTFQPLAPGGGAKIRGAPSAGFTLRFDAKGTVNAVVPGSTAERRGMRPGDTILDIAGRPGRSYDPRAWDNALAARKPLTVRWLRGRQERTDTLDVTERR